MSQINNKLEGPLWKPEKRGPKPPKRIKVRVDTTWLKTRKAYLEGKMNHQGYYQCEMCNKYTEGVEVHHKEGRKARPDLKYALNNLIALCGTCHGSQHGQIR